MTINELLNIHLNASGVTDMLQYLKALAGNRINTQIQPESSGSKNVSSSIGSVYVLDCTSHIPGLSVEDWMQ